MIYNFYYNKYNKYKNKYLNNKYKKMQGGSSTISNPKQVEYIHNLNTLFLPTDTTSPAESAYLKDMPLAESFSRFKPKTTDNTIDIQSTRKVKYPNYPHDAIIDNVKISLKVIYDDISKEFKKIKDSLNTYKFDDDMFDDVKQDTLLSTHILPNLNKYHNYMVIALSQVTNLIDPFSNLYEQFIVVLETKSLTLHGAVKKYPETNMLILIYFVIGVLVNILLTLWYFILNRINDITKTTDVTIANELEMKLLSMLPNFKHYCRLVYILVNTICEYISVSSRNIGQLIIEEITTSFYNLLEKLHSKFSIVESDKISDKLLYSTNVFNPNDPVVESLLETVVENTEFNLETIQQYIKDGLISPMKYYTQAFSMIPNC